MDELGPVRHYTLVLWNGAVHACNRQRCVRLAELALVEEDDKPRFFFCLSNHWMTVGELLTRHGHRVEVSDDVRLVLARRRFRPTRLKIIGV